MGDGLSWPTGDVGHWGDSQVRFLRGEAFYAAVCFLLKVFCFEEIQAFKEKPLKEKKNQPNFAF